MGWGIGHLAARGPKHNFNWPDTLRRLPLTWGTLFHALMYWVSTIFWNPPRTRQVSFRSVFIWSIKLIQWRWLNSAVALMWQWQWCLRWSGQMSLCKKALREEDDNIPINNFWADRSAAFFAPLIQRWIQTPSYHTGFVIFLTWF